MAESKLAELYQRMRKTQLFVTNEIAYCEIGNSMKHNKQEGARGTFERLCKRMKQYYTVQMMLANPNLRTGPIKGGKPTVVVKDAFASVDKLQLTELRDFRERSLNEFCEFCAGIRKDDAELVDMVTFSLIPTYFRFFMTSTQLHAFKDFLTYFRAQEPELYWKFGRAAFVHPQFLDFVSNELGSVLFPLMPSASRGLANRDKLAEAVASVVGHSHSKVPLCAALVLACAPEESRGTVFHRCFWEPFVEDPRRFAAYSYTRRVDTRLLSGFVDWFRTTDSFAKCITVLVADAEHTLETGCRLIGKRDEAIDPPAFQRTVYRELDLRILKRDPKKKQILPTPDAMQLFRFLEPSTEKPPEAVMTTMCPTDTEKRIAYNLREMLKRAPLLNENENVDRFTDPLDLIKEYLVDQAPIEIFPEQLFFFNELVAEGEGYAGNPFSAGTFDIMEIEHTDQMKKLQETSNLNQMMFNIYQSTDKIVSHCVLYLEYLIIKSCKFAVPEDAAEDPRVCRQAFWDMRSHFSDFIQKNFGTGDLRDLFYHIVAEKVSYVNYMITHPHLATLDRAFALCARKYKASENATDEVKFILRPENLPALEPYVELIHALAEADDDPLSKLWTFVQVQQAMANLIRILSTDNEVDPGKLLGAQIGLVLHAEPQKFVSSVAFVTEFLFLERRSWPSVRDVYRNMEGPMITMHAIVNHTLHDNQWLFRMVPSQSTERQMCVVGGDRAVTTLMGLAGLATGRASFENSTQFLLRWRVDTHEYLYQTTFSREGIPKDAWDAIVYCYEPSQDNLSKLAAMFKPYFKTSRYMLILCEQSELAAVQGAIGYNEESRIFPLAVSDFHNRREIAAAVWGKLTPR